MAQEQLIMVDYVSMYKPIADNAAILHGVPVDLFSRLIQSESGFNPSIVNPEAVITKAAPGGENAIGIAQFLPSTAKEKGIDPLDPAAALDASAKMLAGLYNKLGTWNLAIAAYKGYSDLNYGANTDTVKNVVGDTFIDISALNPFNKIDAQDNVKSADTPQQPATVSDIPDGSVVTWGFAEWGQFFKAKSIAIIFLLLGLAIIVFSLYAIIVRGKSQIVSSVNQSLKG